MDSNTKSNQSPATTTNVPINKREFVLSMRIPVYIGVLIAMFIVLLHKLAGDFGWYWIFRWIDNPMHILGGLFAGYVGLLIYVFRTFKTKPPLWPALVSALVIGVAWEYLESFYGIAGLDPIHRFDTIKDLVNDMIGSVLSLLVWDLFVYKKFIKNS